ncbi:hypothetical protein [Planktotalea sp.]|uniref:hypothetical protein n=1 Tax=Planktotalea sp. TaxID=2029877 RepID=UPI00329A0EDD
MSAIDRKLDGVINRPDDNEQKADHIFEKATLFLEEWWFTRFMFVVGLALAIGASWIYYDEWQDRKEERISRAWQALSSQVAGNTGKADAIEFLVENGVQIVGLTLTGDSLQNGPFLSGLELTDQVIRRSHFRYAEFGNLLLENVSFRSTTIEDSLLEGSMRDVVFSSSEVINTLIVPDGTTSLFLNNSVFDQSTVTNTSALNGLRSRFYLEIFNQILPNWSEFQNANPEEQQGFWEDFISETIAEAAMDESEFDSFLNLIKTEEFRTVIKAGDPAAVLRLFESFQPTLIASSSSLRCLKLPIDMFAQFEIDNSNISGADFSTFGRVSNRVQISGEMLGNFYYTDNPPIGLPERINFEATAIDREQAILDCSSSSSSATMQDLNNRVSFDAVCSSLLSAPARCERSQ